MSSRDLRKIFYFSRLIWSRLWRSGSILLLHKVLISTGTLSRFGSIAISSISLNSSYNTAFNAATRQALELIQKTSPRHFRLIEREVRYIVNQELTSCGAYSRLYRECRVDFARYFVDKQAYHCLNPGDEHYTWYLAQYASALVHEAVHGRLYSWYIPYTKTTRLRIEQICRAEERRFAVRLSSDEYDFARELVPDIDVAWYKRYWNATHWQYKKALLARMREAMKQSKCCS